MFGPCGSDARGAEELCGRNRRGRWRRCIEPIRPRAPKSSHSQKLRYRSGGTESNIALQGCLLQRRPRIKTRISESVLCRETVKQPLQSCFPGRCRSCLAAVATCAINSESHGSIRLLITRPGSARKPSSYLRSNPLNSGLLTQVFQLRAVESKAHMR